MLLFVLLVIVSVVKAVQIIPQAQAAVIERLGRYQSTQTPGLAFLVPFIDRIRERIDLREQVVSFPPQPVITQDNLTVNIDTVVYYQVSTPSPRSTRSTTTSSASSRSPPRRCATWSAG